MADEILAAMATTAGRYYGRDLALVHPRGFGFHAAGCADGILALVEPVRRSAGVVLELGCGSGLLTRHLVDAGAPGDRQRCLLRDARTNCDDRA